MKRSLAVLLCLLFVCAVLAAPAPPVFFKPGWDAPVDPDKDCKMVQKEDMLTIELPGKPHDILAAGKRNNAPRLLRDVKGDFRVDVRVRCDCTLPMGDPNSSPYHDLATYASGGLLILLQDDDKNVIRFEYGHTTGEKWGPFAGYITVGERGNGSSYCYMSAHGEGWPLAGGAKHMHLRLECRANILRAYYRADGKTWVDFQRGKSTRIPEIAKPKVGLAAYSTLNERCKVYFDQFNLTVHPAER